MLTSITPCKGLRIPESGKILLMESGIQLKESGIPLTIGIQDPTDKHWNRVPGLSGVQLKESGIPLKIGIHNPTDKHWNRYLESGIDGVESRIQDHPGFSYMGRPVPHSFT